MKDYQKELEALVGDDEAGYSPDYSALQRSEIAYQLAIILIDGGTAYIVGQLTLWYYGVLWFLGNAIVFFVHHMNWERPENNEKQEQNSKVGMIVSVGSMFVSALAAGSVFVLGLEGTWIKLVVELLAVGLFCFHALQFAMFRFADDVWQSNRTLSRNLAKTNKRVLLAKTSGKMVEGAKLYLAEREKQYQKHGEAPVNNALGTLGVKMSKVDDFIPENPTPGQEQK